MLPELIKIFVRGTLTAQFISLSFVFLLFLKKSVLLERSVQVQEHWDCQKLLFQATETSYLPHQIKASNLKQYPEFSASMEDKHPSPQIYTLSSVQRYILQ